MATGAYAAIVVGADGSTAANAAVRHAAEMAAKSGATLHIVSAYVANARVALEVAGEAVGQPGLRVRRHSLAGDPVEALRTVAHLVSADLIVVDDPAIARRLRKVRPPIGDRVVDVS